jgi:hypothetical protein
MWSAGLFTPQRSARLRRSLRNPLMVGFECCEPVELAQARLGALEGIARPLRDRRQARWATVAGARREEVVKRDLVSSSLHLTRRWSRFGPRRRLARRPEPVRRA